jgi:CHAT domain-containing protein
VQFNALAEADRQFGRAEQLYRRANEPAGQAEAQAGKGFVLLLREDYTRARATLELAARTQQALGGRRSAAWTRLLVGDVQRRQGDTAAARRSLTQTLDSLRSLNDVVGEAAGLGALGALDRQAGMPVAAESLYRRGLEGLRDRIAPDVSWQLHEGLGRALRSRNALPEAAAEMQAAVADVERVAGALPVADHRTAYRADKWEVYSQLALVERARGRTEAAFEASERMRARQMLDLLARGRVSPPEDKRDGLTSREQDLRRRITELTRRLEGNAARADVRGPDLERAAPGVRDALARTEDAYANLLVELREASPEYATLVTGEIASAQEVIRRLAPDAALLEYLLGDSTSMVFVVTSDGVNALDLGVGRDTLASLVDFARGALERTEHQHAGAAWRAPLRRLFDHLVAPVESSGLLRGKRLLLIVRHAELHYLPFAALIGPGRSPHFLIERYDVAYVPSASVWVRLRQRGAKPVPSGVLALAPRSGALPGSQAEVEAIRELYRGRVTLLVGSRASKRAFRTESPRYGVVHLATYGVLNKHNPLFSYVELAPQGGDDGRLEVHEVFGLGLAAELVVLSACQTAPGAGALADVPAGDDWVGLVQAFLYSGAANVLATLWPVEDQATARFMERFYRGLRSGRTEAAALAGAQRAALRDPATAHPFFWAPFTLVGAGER